MPRMPLLASVMCIEPPKPLLYPVSRKIHLGGHLVDVAALGDQVAVAAMVLAMKSSSFSAEIAPTAHGLLADIDVERAVELVLAGEELFLDALFPPAGLEHLGVHVDELVFRAARRAPWSSRSRPSPSRCSRPRRRAGDPAERLEERSPPYALTGLGRQELPLRVIDAPLGGAVIQHVGFHQSSPWLRPRGSGWNRTCDIFFLLDVRRRSPSQTRRTRKQSLEAASPVRGDALRNVLRASTRRVSTRSVSCHIVRAIFSKEAAWLSVALRMTKR